MTAAEWLPLLQEIADEADGIARRFFRAAGLRVETKPDQSPVTEADRAIEHAARAVVQRRHPDLEVLGEELGGPAKTERTRLIIDPIDGTRNFVRGVPVFATLLAIEQEGEVVAGCVSAPALGMRWRAARGAGAYAGDRRVRVSSVSDLSQASLFHGNLARAESRPPAGFEALVRRVERTRGFGDFYQHMLVAEGAGEIAIDPRMQPWDIAAVQVIVEEAGGRATSLAGERSIYAGSLLTSNGGLHDLACGALTSGGAT